MARYALASRRTASTIRIASMAFGYHAQSVRVAAALSVALIRKNASRAILSRLSRAAMKSRKSKSSLSGLSSQGRFNSSQIVLSEAAASLFRKSSWLALDSRSRIREANPSRLPRQRASRVREKLNSLMRVPGLLRFGAKSNHRFANRSTQPRAGRGR